MKITSGRSLPTVSALTTKLLCRMPRMLIAARTATIEVSRTIFGAPDVTRGQ